MKTASAYCPAREHLKGLTPDQLDAVRAVLREIDYGYFEVYEAHNVAVDLLNELDG